MISVIIPYYNPKSDAALDRLLERAVGSAVGELDGRTDFEVIVVNDGSPRPPAMAAVCTDRRIKFPGRTHGCLGAARNTGMEHASGNIITFLDSDDFYLPGTLWPCIQAMTENGADLLGFGFMVSQLETGTESPAQRPPRFSTPTDGNSHMRSHNLFGSSCMYLIDRRLVDVNGLRFMENSYIEDEEFTPRLVFHARRFVHTDYKVYGYFKRNGSIITTMTAAAVEERQRNTENVLARLLEFRDSKSNVPHDGLDRKISTLAVDCLRRALRSDAWRNAADTAKSRLADMGLYPIPDNTLPPGIRLYAKLSESRIGLYILHLFEKGRQ